MSHLAIAAGLALLSAAVNGDARADLGGDACG
jgi:hypothetical protein